MKILNIAAGKFLPLSLSGNDISIPKYIVNVDTSYFSSTINVGNFEYKIDKWYDDPDTVNQEDYINMDAFEFMERTRIKFNSVSIYRFLEHVSFTQIEYFIYLVSTVLEKGGIVDVIVPNYTILAEMLLNEEVYFEDKSKNFQSHNILLTTELLNEPSCPHASIWTPNRMKYFWELENRFKVVSQQHAFNFDGRDIYLRSIIERL